MPKIKQAASYVCIREAYTFNKHFMPGDDFPENWLKSGYKPNRHFAPAQDAARALAEAEDERMMFSAGDDKRSTAELKDALNVYVKTVPGSWTRKKIWLELIRHEAAAARDAPGAIEKPVVKSTVKAKG